MARRKQPHKEVRVIKHGPANTTRITTITTPEDDLARAKAVYANIPTKKATK